MITPEIQDKLENIINHTRQSAKTRNDSDSFVREVVRRAKEAHINDVLPVEHIDAIAAEGWIKPMVRSKANYPSNILEIASQRRNHKLMLKLLRHPDDTMRIYAADQFQILFSMLDGWYDEASSLVNQVLVLPTEIPAVKAALLNDMGKSSRRGLPRDVGDIARRLIHDVDQVVSYHALRLLTTLYDVRDWKAVLDRMVTLVGEHDEPSEYFLSAGVEYLQSIVQYEPSIVEWFKSLIETYPENHRAMKSLQSFVRRNPDAALEIGLIDRRIHKELTSG